MTSCSSQLLDWLPDIMYEQMTTCSFSNGLLAACLKEAQIQGR